MKKNRNKKKIIYEIHCEDCNSTKEEFDEAFYKLLEVLTDMERSTLLEKPEELTNEEKRALYEYEECIKIFQKAEAECKTKILKSEFDSHKGTKNSKKPKNSNTMYRLADRMEK